MQVNDTYHNIAFNAPLSPSPFKPTTIALRVNQTWLFSLSVSIAACVLSMLAKAWLTEYSMGLTYTGNSRNLLRDQARLRQHRWEALNKWLVPQIIALIPLILHFAVLLFAIGLAALLWELDQGCAEVITFLTGLASVVYLGTTVLPCIWTSCPYKTPLSHFCINTIHFPRFLLEDSRPLLDNLARAEQILMEKEDKEDKGPGGKWDLDERCMRWLDTTRRTTAK